MASAIWNWFISMVILTSAIIQIKHFLLILHHIYLWGAMTSIDICGNQNGNNLTPWLKKFFYQLERVFFVFEWMVLFLSNTYNFVFLNNWSFFCSYCTTFTGSNDFHRYMGRSLLQRTCVCVLCILCIFLASGQYFLLLHYFLQRRYLIEKAFPHCQSLHYKKFAIHIVRKSMSVFVDNFFFFSFHCLISMQFSWYLLHCWQSKELPSNYKNTDSVFTFDFFY